MENDGTLQHASRTPGMRREPPITQEDPFSEAFLADPYPHYAVLRELAAVVKLGTYGVYYLSRHAEVHKTLNDWQSFCSSRGVGITDFKVHPPWRPSSLLLEADPPNHTKARAVVSRVLSANRIRTPRATFAFEAEQLVDRLMLRGSFDGVRDLAQMYPLKVFPDAVGIAPEGREHLLPYGDMVFNAYGPPNELLKRSMVNVGVVQDWIANQCREETLSHDGLGREIYRLCEAEGMTPAEAALLVRSFLTAGVDTSVTGIAALLYAFSRNPQQWDILRGDPSLVRSAFDEVLRLESPVQTFFRTCTRDIEVAEFLLPEGAKVLMSLASANRDPRRWESPDLFDIRRRTNGHVAFGAGIHACVGQMVARMEAELILTALLKRVRRIEGVGEVRWRLNNSMRAYASLPILVT